MGEKLDEILKKLDEQKSQGAVTAVAQDGPATKSQEKEDPNTMLLRNLIDLANTSPGGKIVGTFLSQMLFQPLWRSVARFLKSIEEPLAEISELTDLKFSENTADTVKWNDAIKNFRKSVYVQKEDGSFVCKKDQFDPKTETCYQYELKKGIQEQISAITNEMNDIIDKIDNGTDRKKMQQLTDEIANFLSRTIAVGSISAIRGFTLLH